MPLNSYLHERYILAHTLTESSSYLDGVVPAACQHHVSLVRVELDAEHTESVAPGLCLNLVPVEPAVLLDQLPGHGGVTEHTEGVAPGSV